MKKIDDSAPSLSEDGSTDKIAQLLEECPTCPGVYLMKDHQGDILYVGKAKNLKNRVRSYFQKSADHSGKTVVLVSHIRDMEFLTTATEVEALLLENNLIKKWRPRYNIRLKDDKTYPYLRLDLKHDFPRPYIARRQFKGDGSEYFGPFPDGSAARTALEMAAKVFLIRDCRDSDFANRSRPCLSYQIGQCTAPCVNYVTKEQYAQQIEGFRSFLAGGSDALEAQWETEMQAASEAMEFEKAALLRDRIAQVRAVTHQEQRMVDTKDFEDRDVWALYPEPGPNGEAPEAWVDFLVLQFRAGKWVGQVHIEADMSERIETEDFVATAMLEYYQKHPIPGEIMVSKRLVPDFGGMAEILVRAATAGNKKGTPAPELPVLHDPGEKAEWVRLGELANDNVRQAHQMRARRREQRQDGLVDIARMLDLEAPPRRIECVDISNFQGEANVASCVVFSNGRPDKAEYRHYKIQGFSGQNDFASMREVMSRRYGKPDSLMPDLLVVDGGKGQLASALEILQGLGCTFPIVGLAKARTKRDFQSSEVESSEERIFVPNQKNYLKIKSAEALRILVQIRDEAHRFAIEFHRKKRDASRFEES